MKYITLILLGVTLTASAQKVYHYDSLDLEPMTFEIGACKGSMLQPVKNDSIVWEVWVEPIGRVNDSTLFRDYYCGMDETFEQRAVKHGLEPAFQPLDSGTLRIVYTTSDDGIHHIIARNAISGEMYAYVTLGLDKGTLYSFQGARKKIQVYNNKAEFANWSPGVEMVDGLYQQGLLD